MTDDEVMLWLSDDEREDLTHAILDDHIALKNALRTLAETRKFLTKMERCDEGLCPECGCHTEHTSSCFFAKMPRPGR